MPDQLASQPVEQLRVKALAARSEIVRSGDDSVSHGAARPIDDHAAASWPAPSCGR